MTPTETMQGKKRTGITRCIFLYAPNGDEVTDVHYISAGQRKHRRCAGWISPPEAIMELGLVPSDAKLSVAKVVRPPAPKEPPPWLSRSGRI